MAKNSDKSNGNAGSVARGETDLMLDAQQLRVEGVNLSLAGILNVEIEHLEAELVLEADLEEVAGLLRQLVSTLGENPDLLQNLLQSLTTTVEGVTEAATDDTEPAEEAGSSGGAAEGEVQEARLTVDEEGSVVETSFDKNGQVTGEETVGSLEDMEITDAAGEKAKELGVDLSSVEGTGQNGRILVRDIEGAAEEAES